MIEALPQHLRRNAYKFSANGQIPMPKQFDKYSTIDLDIGSPSSSTYNTNCLVNSSSIAKYFVSLFTQVSDFFARLIQRVSPKSYEQAKGEVFVTQKFLENFSGDQVFK